MFIALVEPAVGEVLRDCIASLQPSWNLTGFPVLLFGTTDSIERVSPKILSCFKHEVVFEVNISLALMLLTSKLCVIRHQAKQNGMRSYCRFWLIVHSHPMYLSRTWRYRRPPLLLLTLWTL